MKLIMAVSADGYVARGPDDDMSWTGREDKAVFQLMTLSTDAPLLAGRRTADFLPRLRARTLQPLSLDPAKGMTLEQAFARWPDAWLIGGQTVAERAIAKGFIDRTYLCFVCGASLGLGEKLSPTLLRGRLLRHIQLSATRVTVVAPKEPDDAPA
jgi:dihydrofolate reductase